MVGFIQVVGIHAKITDSLLTRILLNPLQLILAIIFNVSIYQRKYLIRLHTLQEVSLQLD